MLPAHLKTGNLQPVLAVKLRWGQGSRSVRTKATEPVGDRGPHAGGAEPILVKLQCLEDPRDLSPSAQEETRPTAVLGFPWTSVPCEGSTEFSKGNALGTGFRNPKYACTCSTSSRVKAGDGTGVRDWVSVSRAQLPCVWELHWGLAGAQSTCLILRQP